MPPDDARANEPFDVYTDQFIVTITPFGANLSLEVREAHPATGRAQQSRRLGTLRMSVEHMKTMIMIMRRQILQVEESSGVKAEMAREVLNQMSISPEDWDSFWSESPSL